MPKSKRERVVSLSKTRRKNEGRKDALISSIRDCVDKYERLFLLRVPFIKSKDMDMMRRRLEGRLYFLKNTLFRRAICPDDDSEHAPGLTKVSEHLSGQIIAVFTSQTDEELKPLFSYTRVMYAKEGAIAPQTIVLHREDLSDLPSSSEPYVRALGVDCKVEQGKVVVQREKTVCTEGKPVTAEEARLLKLLKFKCMNLKITPFLLWEKSSGVVTRLAEPDNMELEKDEDSVA